MDRNILRQYLSGLAGANNRFLLENSQYLGNLPQNIVYNGLLYTLNLRENAFINQFGHRIDPSAASAFITEARAFEQQNLAILDIASSSSDNSSSRPQPESGAAEVKDLQATPDNTKDPTTGVIVTFTIDDPDKADSFIIYRATDPNGPFESVKGDLDKFARAFEDSGLFAGTTYYYQVSAVLDGKEGPKSTVVVVTTDSVKPPSVGITAPSGLTALSISQTSISLSWTDNSTNELGFYVYQSLNGTTFALIEGLGAGVTNADVKGLVQDNNYWYRVQAYATGSTSAFSNTINIRTLPTLPAAPTGLSLLVGGTSQISLSWTDNSTNEQYFNIFRTTDGGASYILGATVGANSTAYIATGLSAGITYGFRVNAANTGGTSGFAGPAFATTLPIAPSTPSFTSISGTTNSITVNWNNVANETGYNLYRSTTLEGTYTGLTTLGANVTTFVNTGLSSGTTFFYKIDAFNSGGTSALSGATSFTTTSATPIPTAPSNLRFTGRGSSRLIFAWDDNSADETGFVIQSSANGVSYTTLDTVGAGITDYDASGLSSGTTYFFQVASFNSGGTSSFAGPTAWKTLPAAPTNLNATTGSTSTIELDWSDVVGEDGYVLNRGLTNSFTTFVGITLAANTNGYIDSGLCAGTIYWYRLYAFLNDGGTSGFAGPTFALTQEIAGGTPSSPTGFTSIDATTNSVTLQWTDTATNEDGFLIYYRGIT